MADSFQPLTVTKKDSYVPSTQQQDSFIPLGAKTNLGIPQGGPLPTDKFDGALSGVLNFIRPFVSNAVGAGAATLAAPLAPFTAGGAPILAETQGYALTDNLLKQIRPNNNESFKDGMNESETEALVNAVGGRILQGVFRGLKAYRNSNVPEIYKFTPTTSQALESYGMHALATLPRFAEDFGAAGAKSDALDRSAGEGFTQALRFTNQINGRMASTNSDPVKLADKIKETLQDVFDSSTPSSSPFSSYTSTSLPSNLDNQFKLSQEALDVVKGGATPFAKLDAAIKDPDRLSKILAVAQLNGTPGVNVRKDLQAYQFMKMFNDATTHDMAGTVTRIDPDKIAQVWNDPEMKTSLDTLWGKQGRDNVSNFLDKIATTQAPQQQYMGHRAMWLMTGGVGLKGAVDLLEGNLGSAAGTVGMFIGAHALGRMLTDPTNARILTAMAGGEPLGQAGRIAARQIFNGLQGSMVALINSKGEKDWGSVEKDPQTGSYRFMEK